MQFKSKYTCVPMRKMIFIMLYIHPVQSWGRALYNGYWWITNLFTLKHQSHMCIICLSCQHFPILALFFCGWITAAVCAKQQQYREKLLIHDKKNTRLHAQCNWKNSSPNEEFWNITQFTGRYSEKFYVRCVLQYFIAFCYKKFSLKS